MLIEKSCLGKFPSQKTDLYDARRLHTARQQYVEKFICDWRRTRPPTRLAVALAQQARTIDQLVYRLYGLTEEEIKIVEGAKHD